MRRVILLALTTTLAYAAIAGFHEWTPPAHAAGDSTCSTHQVGSAGWSIQLDFFKYSWDFQCGGANNEPYQVDFRLQWKDSSSVWHTFDCDNGNPCLVGKPGLLSYYQGGDEHQDTGQFNVAGQLNCQTVRVHATVLFEFGSPSINYNSLTYNIGC